MPRASPIDANQSLPGERRVLVGAIAGAHGVRGEVRIKSFTADPLAVADYGPVSNDSGRQFRLKLRGQVRGLLIAQLDGVADRNAAEALKGTRLYVPRSVLPAPSGDEWYVGDLEGLSAETSDGAVVGRIKSVANYGAGDVLEIEQLDGTALLLPFTARTVPVVDIAGGRVVVDPPVETEVQSQTQSAGAAP
jgi:16S rRNA processing protein RimM